MNVNSPSFFALSDREKRIVCWSTVCNSFTHAHGQLLAPVWFYANFQNPVGLAPKWCFTFKALLQACQYAQWSEFRLSCECSSWTHNFTVHASNGTSEDICLLNLDWRAVSNYDLGLYCIRQSIEFSLAWMENVRSCYVLNQMLEYEFYLAELFFYVAERTESSFNKGQTTTDFLYYL